MATRLTERASQVIIVLLISLAALPLEAVADAESEAAAAKLVQQAQDLLAKCKPEEALSLLTQVTTDYPDTGEAAHVGVHRGMALLGLHRYDEAIADARNLIATSQLPVVVEWSRVTVGLGLVYKGMFDEGIAELLTVADLRPSYGGGPMNTARDVLGRLCTERLGDLAEVGSAHLLGLDKLGKAGKAEASAIVAAYRAQQGMKVWARNDVQNLGKEYPSAKGERIWAEGRIAFTVSPSDPELRDWAAGIIRSISVSTDYDWIAQKQAQSWLVEYEKTTQ